MTRKLYYEDSYKECFEAEVISCEREGELYKVVLNETAFYPGGGGQPHDRGTLNSMELEGIYEEADTIYHLLAEPLQVGDRVKGEVYIEKRIDYMIQHTGEHIISGIIHKWFGYANVGFHLSESYMTADFDGELTKEQLDMIELKANDAVFRNVPITAKVYQVSEDIPSYRAKLAFDTEVRLVDVEGYDTCACCGTHIATTGEIGIIKIIGYEKHRGGCRLTILCGRRAVYDYQSRFDELGEVSNLLSARVGKVTTAVSRLQDEANRLRQERYIKNKSYLEEKAKHYPKDRPLCIIEEGLEMDEMKMLADILAGQERETTLILVPQSVGFKYIAISQKEDVRPFCKELNQRVNGKGGGKVGLCQGSATGDIKVAEAYFYQTFKSWVEEIKTYAPYNEQEEKDKEVFLNYIHHFDNTLDRSNEIAHVTSSAWIVNKDRTKVLMAHHNIYNAWAWTGGHNDGDGDMLGVAIKEAIEETGVQHFEVVQREIFSIDVLPVTGHIKKGKYVASHLHLSIAYLLEANEEAELCMKEDENSGVMWIPIEEVKAYTANEPDMYALYSKFMEKVNKLV